MPVRHTTPTAHQIYAKLDRRSHEILWAAMAHSRGEALCVEHLLRPLFELAWHDSDQIRDPNLTPPELSVNGCAGPSVLPLSLDARLKELLDKAFELAESRPQPRQITPEILWVASILKGEVAHNEKFHGWLNDRYPGAGRVVPQVTAGVERLPVSRKAQCLQSWLEDQLKLQQSSSARRGAAIAPRFLIGSETEYLNVEQSNSTKSDSTTMLVSELRRILPWANGPSGIFHPYGRFYVDGSHFEFASAECDSPLTLIQIMEQHDLVLTQAVAACRRASLDLLLANTNHSGFLLADSATWGAHENYLSPVKCEQLGKRLLPFLASRVYTGAGGINAETGKMLASVRTQFLDADWGGDTVNPRALHSTIRQEHHTPDPDRFGFRYHTMLGDSNRSQFSMLLRFGTTMLVVNMLAHAPELIAEAAIDSRGLSRTWVEAARYMNVLKRTRRGLIANPWIVRIQAIYLQAVQRFASRLVPCPPWVNQVLNAWASTLTALAECDHAWLSRRLDPWIKYGLFRRELSKRQVRWKDLPKLRQSLAELELLNHSYHEIANPSSVFRLLDDEGRLQQRVVPQIAPGAESVPFVPNFGTRATDRARVLVGLTNRQQWKMDWSSCSNGNNTMAFDEPMGKG